jgi:hypothetical protein
LFGRTQSPLRDTTTRGQISIMDLPQSDIQFKKKQPVYYYRNSHGKVVSLSEDIAFEQHRLHPQYFGSSKDLEIYGYNPLEAIASFLKENVTVPSMPPDNRHVGFQDKKKDNSVEVQDLKSQIEELKKLIINGNNKVQKPENQGVSGDNGTTQQGNAS